MRLWLLPLLIAACTPLPDLSAGDDPPGDTPLLMAVEALVGDDTPAATSEDIARLQARAAALRARAAALRAR